MYLFSAEIIELKNVLKDDTGLVETGTKKFF